VVTENDSLRLPINDNIMAASLYLIVHMVHRVPQPARPLSLPAPNIQHQAQCDPGANISATNNINVLQDTVDLEKPFPISSANRTAQAMMASIRGTCVLSLLDGSTCDIPMFYCPSLADTIVSPQHFTSSDNAGHWYNGCCIIYMPGCFRILLLHTRDNDASFIVLKKINDMYSIAGSTPLSSGPRVSRLAIKPQLLSELWHQRFGHPGQTELSVLAKHSTGLPSMITAGLHPMHYFQACNDEKIRHAPMGANSNTDTLLPGTCFHLYFGFMHA
jgi:hypothetical protein